ncbi:UvrD-helicase domain-containing protein [Amycolatopsis jiangsuensis]|uniref:DNA 3'-5' helicase n=1 Tax=Amycolatopsis jiangsuensis TaxID=1181879 RepID=A0A840IQK5_9PSEU|nr:UvrD-helicase domain-containing protein [Amycolatopsis jiangsuensis]MBB4683735.1 hypothetical protein [Amycolatopsis jiangsuensis]
MAKLGIDKEFLREFSKLEKTVQQRVLESFGKFDAATHAGAHLEKITNARDDHFRTIRIDQFWRGVVLAPESGDSYTLLKVLPHDDAYAWAQRRTASVNTATGRIEIRDTEAIDATLPALSQMAASAPARLFDGVKDAELRKLGIDEQTLQFARALTDPVQLDASKSFLPQNQWDALYGLAAGLSPEEVWAEVGAFTTAGEVDTSDIGAAVERSTDRVVLVDGPEELMVMFERPFDLWRVYLHPQQRRLAESSFSGPAQVKGGPGTGKTVVALHRAHNLAQAGAGRILVTTYISTLPATLSAGLKLLADSPGVLDHIDIRHVDQLSHQIYREQHGAPLLLRSDQEKELWRSAARKAGAHFSEAFLAEEWRQVVLAQEVTDADDYRAADRTGRGRRLGARQKAQVWQVIWEFRQELRRRNLSTHETICIEATRLLNDRLEKPYRHIVVDEAQDLSPVHWRLLRAAVPQAPDDLFLAGDTHQRIYNSRVSFRDVGIAIAGRSSKLNINYRTTAEILAWSLGLIRGERIDDMDGGLDSIAGCRSDVHGMTPELKGFGNWDTELANLTKTVTDWIAAGVHPAEIGIAARSNYLVTATEASLGKDGIPVRALASASTGEDAVSVGTMHRMKGLEFRCLAVVGAGARQVPLPNAVTAAEEDQITHEHDMQRERCLLFVACTRAREQLSVSWHGASSPFLTALA